MTNTLRHFLLPLAMTGVATLLALPLASCNIVTPIAYAIEGPGQIDAEYTLPDKKTVVFVDDPRNILPRTALRTAIGDKDRMAKTGLLDAAMLALDADPTEAKLAAMLTALQFA